jgi:microcystin degradation protein MlrC
MKKRVGIIGLLHESNTFVPFKTTLRHFEEDTLAVGNEVRARFSDAPHEIGGFFHGLASAGIDAVPIFAARAIPFGPITADAYESLVQRMLAALDEAGSLDGVLAAPHGATVSEKVHDVDGHWLGLVREHLGRQTPLIATIDAHANVSEKMVDATDALIAYRTNPHLDQFARGVEAAELMSETLRTGRRLKQVAQLMPLAINIQSQNTSQPPLKPICQLADRIRQSPEVASLSLGLGFPFADVPEMGSSAILVSYEDVDPEKRQALLAELVDAVEQSKDQFEPEFVDAAAAVAQAARSSGTTCLLDMGDNVGGGSSADSTILAHELHRHGIGPSFVCLCDPTAIAQCSELKIDDVAALQIGVKTDQAHGGHLDAEVRIVSRHDGRFQETKPMHGGFTEFDQGETVIVETVDSKITIMLTQKRMPPFSLSQLTTCGVDPSCFRAIVAKGVIAPMAAYEEVVKRFIHVNTSGATCADMTQLDYKHRRRPMFPFER